VCIILRYPGFEPLGFKSEMLTTVPLMSAMLVLMVFIVKNGSKIVFFLNIKKEFEGLKISFF
jgi:hypothetical protein